MASPTDQWRALAGEITSCVACSDLVATRSRVVVGDPPSYGHSGASVRLAFVGDVLFRGSIGRTDLPQGNFQQLVDAITGKLWPLGDDMNFVSGHGQMSTFGWERKTNPYVSDLALGRD